LVVADLVEVIEDLEAVAVQVDYLPGIQVLYLVFLIL
jgi:hypothetical protein